MLLFHSNRLLYLFLLARSSATPARAYPSLFHQPPRPSSISLRLFRRFFLTAARRRDAVLSRGIAARQLRPENGKTYRDPLRTTVLRGVPDRSGSYRRDRA